ncbi:polysaccharide deacetylase family protein [Portibacter lacus]|uniref:Polysaccharide deacetylase n=1 Tax=Portibacter lacus TaxID=1099794 RepID=A0AA37SVK8_9BACT|nr:polysaccharide deacetylase family protein [Portibacter lacus]GLR18590.1 polysaccharide deacetylase [Portibacter lacus]
MSMYLAKTPQFFQSLFPNFVWRIPTEEKHIHLTFDDGPIPEVTPWVLDELKKYNAKATFFCVGDNIKKHPEIFQRLLDEGHQVGNHSFNHLSGWATDNLSYFHNIRYCASMMDSTFFRPPYGRIKPTQAQFLQRHYKIIMWDVLSGDFDKSITKEQCYNNVITHTKKGSIVVFHDNIKAIEKLQYTLPKVLEEYSNKGYHFKSIKL